MAWAGYTVDEATKRQLQQAADLHAGNEREPEPTPQPEQPAETINWDAHKRFMRGL